MSIASKISSKLGIAGLSLLGLASVVGCVGDDEDPPASSGGSGGNTGGSGGKSGNTGGLGGGGGGGPVGTACASPIVLSSSKSGIANFDEYDGSADLHKWSFALGGDPASGIYSGTFGYGDEPDGFPENFAMVPGNASTYALSISDTLAEEYGGGMGLWISECLDTRAFSGLSFWVRGNSPDGTAKLTILMQESTPATPQKDGDKIGTCAGDSTTCIHPTHTFAVTDTWTEIEVPWTAFMSGNAVGTAVVPDGRNIWQIQYDVGLVWAPDAGGVYAPTPAPYEFAIDDLTFY